MSPPSQLKERVLAAARARPARTRSQVLRAQALLGIAGGAAGLGVFLFAGGVSLGPRPISLVIATGLGTAIVAAFGIWTTVTRGRSMLGRGWSLAFAALTAPLLILAWKVGVSGLYSGMTDGWPARPGFRCLTLGLTVGALPLLAALAARRRQLPAGAARAGAAMGVGIGLGAAALVDLWCPIAHLPHLLLGHMLPIALLAGAGACLGARWLRVKA